MPQGIVCCRIFGYARAMVYFPPDEAKARPKYISSCIVECSSNRDGGFSASPAHLIVVSRVEWLEEGGMGSFGLQRVVFMA